jgi:hypothetical protein
MKTWDRWRNTDRQPLAGGQGRIFFVTDTRQELPGIYALKELKNPRRADRFQLEIDAIIRLAGHPNVIRVIDHAAFAAGRPFYVMELADRSLAEAISAGSMTEIPDLFGIYREICAGVAHIHAHDIIHRDLKPENILFIGDTPKVADLGLCLIAGLERATPSLEAVGPRFYMAPELEDGRTLDVTLAADIYSLGKILYFMLSGGRIFSREKHDVPAWNLAAVHRDPRYRIFEKIWRHTITPHPRDRFRSVNVLIDAFEAACRSLDAHARSRLFRKLGPLGGTRAAPSAADVGRLSADEADELSSILAEGTLTLAIEMLRALAARISRAGVAAFMKLLEAQNGIGDRDLALIGERLYADEDRAKHMTFGRRTGDFDTRLDGAVLRFSSDQAARTNLVSAKVGMASSDEDLVCMALKEFPLWSEEARTQLLHRCAYGGLGKDGEADLLGISRRSDLTVIQTMYAVAALAQRGSREAVERLIAMGQEIPDEIPDTESAVGQTLRAFVGGLLLRPDVKLLRRMNRVQWKSQALAYGIRVAAEGGQPPGPDTG